MWDFGFPGGRFKLKKLNYDFMGEEYLHEGFDGMVGSTGTFMETGATALGYKKAVPTHRIPLDRLVNVDAFVLQTPLERLDTKDGRRYVSIDDIKEAEKGEITPGAAIVVSTGYGKNWFKEDYLQGSPFFTKEAVYYLLDKGPVLLSSDFPSWENTEHLEGFLPRLYESGTSVLVSVVNVEMVEKFKVRLTALPMNVENVCMCPARAVIIEE